MFQFSCRFAFFISYSYFKPDTQNNANFDAYGLSSKRANFDDMNFLKLIPKLIIFCEHNLQTFKHIYIINELGLLLRHCVAGNDENYASQQACRCTRYFRCACSLMRDDNVITSKPIHLYMKIEAYKLRLEYFDISAKCHQKRCLII